MLLTALELAALGFCRGLGADEDGDDDDDCELFGASFWSDVTAWLRAIVAWLSAEFAAELDDDAADSAAVRAWESWVMALVRLATVGASSTL